MKLFLLGDVHLRAKKLSDVSSAWSRMIHLATELECEYILQAGDVFDHANVFGKEATIGTIYDEFLKPFSADPSVPEMICILGNHDIGGPNNKDALVPVDHHDLISVFRKPSQKLLKGQVGLVMLPWIDRATLMKSLAGKGMSPEESRAKIEELLSGRLIEILSGFVKDYKDRGRPVIFMSHLEVTGAKMDSGMAQSGGLFEFSPKSLSEIGADFYAFGHIHKRQQIIGLPNENDGYLGAICQGKFGEEDNPSGGRFLEISPEGEVLADRWVNDSQSPRYFTVESMAEVMAIDHSKDYVKLRAEARPPDLPLGVIFEKKPTKKPDQKEGDSEVVLDAETSLDVLLQEWGKRNGVEISQVLIDDAKNLKLPASQYGIGSWESLDKIVLKNITSHKDTVVDLNGIRGVIGVEGPNGAGKTSVLESCLFSMYGNAPSYSAQGLLSTMSKQMGLVEVHFTSSGQTYVARRELKGGKNFSHKAFLFKEGSEEPVAGPNVGAVNNECSVLVGDKDLVLAGVFAAQRGEDNIVDRDPADRKEVFAKLIGSEKFLRMSQEAKELAKAESAVIEVTEDRISELKEQLVDDDDLQQQIQSTSKEKDDAEASLEEERTSLEDIKSSIHTANERESQLLAIRAKIAELEKKKKSISEEGRALQEEQTMLLKSDAGEAQKGLDEAKKALEKCLKAKKEVDQISKESASLMAKSSELKAKASEMESSRVAAYTKRRKSAEEAQKKVAEERQTNFEKINSLLEELKGKIRGLETDIRESCHKADLIKGFPDLPECKACVLAKDCIEAKDSVPGKVKELDALKDRVSTGEQKRSAYIQKTNDLVAAEACEEESEFQKDVLAELATLKEKAETLSKEATEKVPSAELSALADKEEALSGAVAEAEANVSKCKDSLSRIETIKALIAKLRESFGEAVKEQESLKETMPKPIDLISLRATQAQAEEAVKEATQKVTDLAVKYGKLESKLEENEKRRAEWLKLSSSISSKKDLIARMTTLTKAFGRDGIPQMLTERTVPRFEELMNELVSEFECGYEIQVLTERTTKKGTKEDVILIQVDDGYGFRDVRSYSGGESRLLKYLVSISFAIIQAERSGKGLKVLILDEAVESLDDDKSGDFIAMAMKLPKFFNQVFIISHNLRILSEIPCKIKMGRIGKHPSTVTVSTSGV